jgi:glycine/D-amino acid oxidase-like deaminating enzyme
MDLSYWEKKTWFSDVDFCIVGSGIVGLTCALELRKKHPKSKILVLERGVLPKGASTKNAGFACYGSVSELLSDLEHHSEDEVQKLVKQRYEGLCLLRETLGDKQISYYQNGGYEVFLDSDKALLEKCHSNLEKINTIVEPVFGQHTFQLKNNTFGFNKCLSQIILNPNEGQIDVGLMMKKLLQKVYSEDILILNGTEVLEFSSDQASVKLQLKNFNFSVKHLFIATNAFTKQLLDLDLKPARNQVIITEPIKNLHINGVFHLNRGYYYFRNIDNRILLGGGRHVDPKREATTDFSLTQEIQNTLENLIKETILPNQDIKIEKRWSGILGIGTQKKPIIKSHSNGVHCAVRLGGMGVAIGSQVGKELAALVV